MSSGGVHTAVSLAAAGGLAYLSHLDLTVVEMAAAAVAGGALPDIDRGTSLTGGLVPQWLAPDVRLGKGRHGRRLGPFLLRHRGPTHSLVVGVLLAALLLPLGIRVAVVFLLCWDLHLLLDGGGQWIWPFSSQWYGRRRAA